jgi:tRNA(adenine34) deaminase
MKNMQNNMTNDEDWMQLALSEAKKSMDAGEVPVGAVLVCQGQLVAAGHNQNRACADPSAHAEIVVLRAAAAQRNNFRLDDCELFVTLEPCAMCAGAMLHARLKRVVFGAPDPKTGAAGSVLNLFSLPQLNHQTRIEGGLHASACAAMLQAFFQHRRTDRKRGKVPLREDALRTPEQRFSDLPLTAWPARYVVDLPALAGLRLYTIDVGCDNTRDTVLCLHGSNSWGVVFDAHIAQGVKNGCRMLIPDLIGFGKSDKPKKESVHTLAFHAQYLLQWLESINARNIRLLVEGSGRIVAAHLQQTAPQRFTDQPIEVLATSTPQQPVLQAPFPDRGYCAGVRALKKWEAHPSGIM